MENIIQTSVIIVGAGPAGASASIFLSKYEIPHIIIEKAIFPRDKVCGDACSGKTTEVLRKANPNWVKEIMADESKFFPCDGISFVAPNGKSLPVSFRLNKTKDQEITGFTSPRMVFDNYLFEKAKAASQWVQIFQGVQQFNLTRNEKATTAHFAHEGKEYKCTAPFVIAADGDKGTTFKQIQHQKESLKSDSVGLRAYYKNVGGMHDENFIELHFMKDFLPGYFWIFPLPNGYANVGVGMPADFVRKNNINLREKMLSVLANHPVIKERFANAQLEGKILGWGLPMATKRRSISGSGYLLTGDAAGLIDPFSGEGIGNAMYSGMLAAQAIQKAFEKNDFSAAFLKENYDGAVYRYFGDEFKISTTMQKLCNYPFLFNMIVNKAQKSPSLSSTISGMFSDMQVRQQLSKPSFYLKVLMNR